MNHMTGRSRIVARLSAAFAAAIFSITALAGAAAAAPSAHVQEHYVSVRSVSLAAPGAMAYIEAFHSSIHGSDAGFQLWVEPDLPWTDPPTYTSGRTDFAVGAADSSLTGTFDVLDRDGAVVGIGRVDALLAPIGDPADVTWPKSAGNHKHRESQVYQYLLVSGAVTVTIREQQIVLPLEGATGFAADFTAFRNDPAATLDWQAFTLLGFSDTDGDAFIQLAMREEGGEAITEVLIQTPDATFVTFDDGSGTTFSGGRYALDLALQPSGEGQGIASSATGGTVSGTATVRPAERSSWSDRYDGFQFRMAVQTYTISGSFTVTFDDGTTRTFTMDNGNGYAEAVTFRTFEPPS